MSEKSRIKPDVQIAMKHTSALVLADVSCFGIGARVMVPSPGGLLHYRIEHVAMDWHLSGAEIFLSVPFELVVEHAATKDSQKVSIGTISVDFSLTYRSRSSELSVPRDEIPHVIGISGYMHAWPYFRADVQWLTTKVGLPSLTLPVVLSGEIPGKVMIAVQPLELPTLAPTGGATTGADGKRRRRRG